MTGPLDRRRLLGAAFTGLGAAMLGGCDRLAGTEIGRRALQAGEDANLFVQRLLLSDVRLAREYPDSDISPWFKPNGTEDPPDRAYKALAKRNFSTFRLEIGGLVERPAKHSLAELRKMPARTQVTRHDCVEGWSCIGKWTGVPVAHLLQLAGLKPNARFVVLHCADTMEGGEAEDADGEAAEGDKAGTSAGAGQTPSPTSSGGGQAGATDEAAGPIRYYESIDLTDAFHPQTILAYDMNGAALPIAHGAPLRLRLERQLGYKSAKYVMRLEVVESFAEIGDGRGGYWEDRGYDWYAGI